MRSYIERRSPRVGLYLRMASRYGKMLAGNSYAHRDQDLGKHFVPGRLCGYYNDLSFKTEWQGPEHRASFLQIATWALGSQDDNGGWETWLRLGIPNALPYSAMAQGEAMSVLVRAFSATGEDAYLEGARRALAPMLLPIEKGGTSWRAPEGLILEEVPFREPKTILNGWVFALYGLYDLVIADGSQDARKALDDTLSALLARLRAYDAGFWSFYDTSRTLASPFYHRLHIAQLEALGLSFPERAGRFRELGETFRRQLASRPNVARAVTLKSYQKLRRPPA